MNKAIDRASGFSLIEVSVVLVVVGLLLGMILTPLSTTFDQSKRKQTLIQLENVREALIGFAAANGRLPCPASDQSGGQEIAGCTSPHGYVPSVTLGLNGSFNEEGLLLDPWGSPLRYSISLADSPDFGTPGLADFVSQGELNAVGMQNLAADLSICSEATSASCPSKKLRANEVPAVIYSIGPDNSDRNDQVENLDGDLVFVAKEYSQAEGKQFDDLVIWLSDNILFARLIEAGVLP